MKTLFLFFLLICISGWSHAQMPNDGTYTYGISDVWKGKPWVGSCKVVIKGDSIKIIDDGHSNLTWKKGDIIDQGIIMKHSKTGKWIIGHNTNDKDATEIGGCTGGPKVIDFQSKLFLCCTLDVIVITK